MSTHSVSRAVAYCGSLLLLILFSTQTFSQPPLRFFPLPEAPGGASRAFSVAASESSVVVCGEVRFDSAFRAVVWLGFIFEPDVDLLEMPTPVATQPSRAYDIDARVLGATDEYLACGSFDSGVGDTPEPIVWTVGQTETTFEVLPTLGGVLGSGEALGVSCGLTEQDEEPREAQNCCGWSSALAGVKRAVVWGVNQTGDWVVEPLPAPVGSPSQANGLIVGDSIPTLIGGWVTTAGDLMLPQVWAGSDTATWSATTLPLPDGYAEGAVLGFTDASDLAAIAAHGWVKDPAGTQAAAVWTRDSEDIWTCLVFDQLDGYAESVASAGQVGEEGDDIFVGTSFNSASDRIATVFRESGCSEVDTLVIGPLMDYKLQTATGIADFSRFGQSFTYICGSAVIQPGGLTSDAASSDPHAYLLTNDLVITSVADVRRQSPPMHISAAPNPFSTSTQVVYDLGQASSVNLGVYDVAGRQVAALVRGFQTPGRHVVAWEGNDDTGKAAVSGVYFVRLESRGCVSTRKIVLLK